MNAKRRRANPAAAISKPFASPSGQAGTQASEFFALVGVTFRDDDRLVFPRTDWTTSADEQWAVLGPNGAGKSLFARTLTGHVVPMTGDVRWTFAGEVSPEALVALVAPHTHRDVLAHESSFYQSRWHSGLAEGEFTVRRFLSQNAVEDINPFEVKARRRDRGAFARHRREAVRLLSIAPLLARRRLGWLSPELHLHHPTGWSCLEVVCSGFAGSIGLHEAVSAHRRRIARAWLQRLGLGGRAEAALEELSLGDQRLVLLARAVVRRPELLVLDEPCQGLDRRPRHLVLGAADAVVRETDASLLFVTHHRRELPACVTRELRLRQGQAFAHCLPGRLPAGLGFRAHRGAELHGRRRKRRRSPVGASVAVRSPSSGRTGAPSNPLRPSPAPGQALATAMAHSPRPPPAKPSSTV